MIEGRKILLGVCGGIAAYRCCELARLFVHAGASVQVVMTQNAAHFITPLTFTALTGNPAMVSEMEPDSAGFTNDVYAHLNLTRGIDCFVIAPATATTLAKLASGVGDNLLTTAYLSCTAPVVIAPAMNVRMWHHHAVQQNLAVLRERGHLLLDVGSGSLACGDEGEGRLAEPSEIFAAVEAAIGAPAETGENSAGTAQPSANGRPATAAATAAGPLSGQRFIVTAGGTREYLDPVRFITNASSGELSLALIEQLLELGAEVELADSGIAVPDGLATRLSARHTVATAFDMQHLLARRIGDCSGLIMFAAIADYGPAKYSTQKRKKDGVAWTIELCETPDVLASISAIAGAGKALVGVSLEDEDYAARAMKKARAKNVDLMLAVELTPELPYGNRALNCALVTRDDILAGEQRRSKTEAARLVADWLAARFAGSLAS